MLAPAPYTDSRQFPAHEEARAHKLVGGRCWKKVFTRHNPADGLTWMTIDDMKTRAKVWRVSEGYFTVKIVHPGFIHIEDTEDESEWTVKDILKLPMGYRVGGDLDGPSIKVDKRLPEEKILDLHKHEVPVTPKEADVENTPHH